MWTYQGIFSVLLRRFLFSNHSIVVSAQVHVVEHLLCFLIFIVLWAFLLWRSRKALFVVLILFLFLIPILVLMWIDVVVDTFFDILTESGLFSCKSFKLRVRVGLKVAIIVGSNLCIFCQFRALIKVGLMLHTSGSHLIQIVIFVWIT